MTETEPVLFLPDALYKTDVLAPPLAPRLLATSDIPFYDAEFFLKQLTNSRDVVKKYSSLVHVAPVNYLDYGEAGDVYRMKMGNADLAVKFMINSHLSEEDATHFLEMMSFPEYMFDLRLARLSGNYDYAKTSTFQNHLIGNIAGSLIGHVVEPDFVDKPEFIFTNKGNIIGFATPMIEGRAFSIRGLGDKPEFPVKKIQANLLAAGVELDSEPAARNAIRQENGQVKLIDLSIADKEILNQSSEKFLHR